MSQNIISLVLTDAQIKAATDALAALEGALAGLISLDPDERRRLTKMGQKSEVFCRQAISVLALNPQIVPPILHVADAQADLLALDRLRPVLDRLQKLAERGSDTEIALGSDVMDVALEGYGLLKVSGKNRAAAHLDVRLGSTRRSAPGNSLAAVLTL